MDLDTVLRYFIEILIRLFSSYIFPSIILQAGIQACVSETTADVACWTRSFLWDFLSSRSEPFGTHCELVSEGRGVRKAHMPLREARKRGKQYGLHNLQDLMQNENVGSFVHKVLRILKW